MSIPLFSASPGQVLSFEKPSQYWLRRALHHRKQGQHQHAAALLRHAVAQEPLSGALRLQYAQSLYDTCCFEASIREAFGALAVEPSALHPYRLISQSMLSLGRRQEAIDAFVYYLQESRTASPSSISLDEDDPLDSLAMDLLFSRPPKRGSARYENLLHRFSHYLATDQLAHAAKLLPKISCLRKHASRTHTLYAMFYQAIGQQRRALHYALLSVRKKPFQVSALCGLASVRYQLGQRSLAASALLAAAVRCRHPHEEHLFCFTASSLHFSSILLAFLQCRRQQQPNRIPTLFNSAILLLRMGNHHAALRYLRQCLALDPADIAVLTIFQAVRQWLQQSLSPQEIQAKAENLLFYPLLPIDEENQLLEAISAPLHDGIPAFVNALQKDSLTYDRFLYGLSLVPDALGRLLFPIAFMISEHSPLAAERLLRNVLFQQSVSMHVKRLALAGLTSLDAKPPYTLWHNKRILQMNPQKESSNDASFLQRLLVLRIRAACKRLNNSAVAMHSLRLLARMTPALRRSFVSQASCFWQDALIRHFMRYYHLDCSAFPKAALRFSPRAKAPFRLLCSLIPLSERNITNELY